MNVRPFSRSYSHMPVGRGGSVKESVTWKLFLLEQGLAWPVVGRLSHDSRQKEAKEGSRAR